MNEASHVFLGGFYDTMGKDMLETVFKKGWSQKDDWVIDGWCLDWYDCW